MSRYRLALAAALAAANFTGRSATAQTWTGAVSTDWSTAGNWNPATVPNTFSAVVNFTGDGLGTVNVSPIGQSSAILTQSIMFSNPTGGYTITSSPNEVLDTSAVTVAAGVFGTQTINLDSGGGLGTPAGNNLVVTNSSTAAATTLVIGPSTDIRASGSLGGKLIFGGPGTTQMSGSFSSSFTVIHGLTLNGPGRLIFSGDGSNLQGGLILNGGTLDLDYSTNTATKLGSGQLQLNGGVVQLTSNAGILVTQSFSGGTLVGAGHTDMYQAGSGLEVEYQSGNITRNAGATVDFSLVNATTTTGNTNGLLGNGPAFSTVGGGSFWATNSGGSLVGLTNMGTNTFSTGTNTDLTQSATVANITTNSLRFNTGNVTLTLSGTNTIQSGGILVTQNAHNSPVTITGGTLTAPGPGELIVHAYGGIVINSAIISAAGLTKTGVYDTLTLGGTNTGLTGPINVNTGSLTVTTPAAVNSCSQINFNGSYPAFGQDFLAFFGDSTNGTLNPPINLSAINMVFGSNSNNSRVTLSGVISSAAGLTVPIYLSSSSTGGFNLTGTNTFTGNVFLNSGFLGINSDASMGNAANALIMSTPLPVGGLEFLNGGVTIARSIVIAGGENNITCNGTDSNTISGVVSGGVNLYKYGTGTLTLTNPGNTYNGGIGVAAGTLSLGSTGGLPAADVLAVSAGATFSAGTSTIPLHLFSLALQGGTFRATGTGQVIGVNQFTSVGVVDFTGAGADTLSLEGASPAITFSGNSTWLSPANTSVIASQSSNFTDVLVTIPQNVTLTNGIALQSVTAGFRISGGGIWYQNSDSTNVANMNATMTVSGGSAYRVTDASTPVGGQLVGNLGTGTFTLDGGTFDYGGSTAATAKAITLTGNGGTIQVESPTTALTANSAIIGPGPLTKAGPGTLIFASNGDSFTSLTVTGGTVQTSSDVTLATGPITIGPLGTLAFTGTTTTNRTIANSGTISIAAGQTLILSAATVGGGFLRGSGTYVVTGGTSVTGATTFSATTVNVTGDGSFSNFTNGGTLTVAASIAGPISLNGFSNEGSGSITFGARTPVGIADFQTYGTMTISPANLTQDFSQTTLVTNTGTSPLNFNGGSRTFIGTPATAVFPSNWPNVSQRGTPTFVAGIDLNGKNAVVAGGLFVNNGYVEDSTNNFTGTATIVADFGSLVKGAGFFQNTVVTQNGGKFQAGNSPGSVTFGRFVLGPGGVNNYLFAIDDATGTAGPSPDNGWHVSGWGLVKAISQITGAATTPGDFTWTATSADKLSISLETLVNPTTVGVDVPGMMDHFDPKLSYIWPAVEWTGTYVGPTDAAILDASTAFDTSGFVNRLNGVFGWSLDAGNNTLSLTYTPAAVPEPGTIALAGLVALGLASRKLRRKELNA
jgi:autotransporter-associated beta strand protein